MDTSAPRGLYLPELDHDSCGVGFVAHLKGDKSRDIVDQALSVLARLAHRGATGADPDTGDGAGILVQLPHRFFKREGLALGFDMPRRRRYGVGMVFLPPDPAERAACERALEEVIADEGQRLLGWRDVPVDPAAVGPSARAVMPVIRQIYIARRRLVPSAFERKLYVIRKLAEGRVRERKLDPAGHFHLASLSAETIVYKGLCLPAQLPRFFHDLRDPDLVSAIAVVHSRFSTNTRPTWDLAQPFRYVAHNGEINTVQGNRNWMNARRSLLESAKFGGKLDRLAPIIVPGKSDSAQFDNMLELLHLAGRSLPHAMMMMIPEAHESNPEMPPERADFYRYSSSLVEPWDGPAAIVFCDGKVVGATLDRNGLRPARYVVTDDDRVVLASEAGVIDLPPHKAVSRGRLRPGRMFLVDTEAGRIVDDDEIKREIAGRFPYGRWLAGNVVELSDMPPAEPPARLDGDALLAQQRAFGYTLEELGAILAPMAESGKEPVGSMGTDTPLAVLSDQAPTLFHYFHQRFAQVTNPAIDPIREALVMTLETSLGPDGNTFEETPEQCHSLKLPSPFLAPADVATIASVHEGVFEPIVLSTLYPLGEKQALERAVASLCARAADAVDDGMNLLILSDRGVDERRAPIPALLALSAVHQHLVRLGTRTQVGLVIETGEAREVHDAACLIGFGAGAVCPWLAIDSVRALAAGGELGDTTADQAERRYLRSLEEGLLKVMSKMGISTLQSYRGAQIFEAVGLDRALIDAHFNGTPSRLGGIGLAELDREAAERHGRGFGELGEAPADRLPIGGRYQWRRRGERHKWNPATIARLQDAVRRDDAAAFAAYAALCDDEDVELVTLRGLLELHGGPAIPLDEVEPWTAIVKRFVTGAMSFGSIGAEVHETLAIAMNRLGARSNSGEGGEEEHRFHPDEQGDLRRSAIKQVASGRFGVTASYLVNADEIQIKIAQGAKPGEGGQLPGHKVDERIAKARHSVPGVTLISPPPHHDIYSIEDLAQLIYDLQAVNPAARVSVKLVAEVGVGQVAAGVVKAGAGGVVIAGYEGGTGASPLSSLSHAGVPWELGLAEAQQVLVAQGLRDRVRLQVDGGLRTGRDVAIAAALGAEEFGLATASLVATGCIMLRKCHLNTCSVGIATQDPELRARFTGTPEHVVSFFRMVAEDVRRHLAALGLRSVDELVGRVDLVRPRGNVIHWKAARLDLAPLLVAPEPADAPRRCREARRVDLAEHLDHQLIARAEAAIDGGPPVELALPVSSRDRAVGALLSGEVARAHGAAGLPDDAIRVKLTGSAGQSLGAFLAAGVTLEVEGEANDYVGKGLSGGRIVVYPPRAARFVAEQNVILGNTCLYGATGGELFVAGQAGERFAVRNSGARAVVEGVGDHACEYMTGGVVVVLGETGRNFGAGMSGGVTYVFERIERFRRRINPATLELATLNDDAERWMLYSLLDDHARLTGSALAGRILDQWELMVGQFVKVLPLEWKRVLGERARARRESFGRPRLQVVGEVK
jgi:glutamate synthase (NADPH) large chain